VSGAANDWPFLYQGGEKEVTEPGPLYYSGGGLAEDVRSLACAGVWAIEIPKKLGEGKCFYDYFQASR